MIMVVIIFLMIFATIALALVTGAIFATITGFTIFFAGAFLAVTTRTTIRIECYWHKEHGRAEKCR